MHKQAVAPHLLQLLQLIVDSYAQGLQGSGKPCKYMNEVAASWRAFESEKM